MQFDVDVTKGSFVFMPFCWLYHVEFGGSAQRFCVSQEKPCSAPQMPQVPAGGAAQVGGNATEMGGGKSSCSAVSVLKWASSD